MINLYALDKWRVKHPTLLAAIGLGSGDSTCGVFLVPHEGTELLCIATDGSGATPVWEHVSVSRPDRCPTWEEMDFVKQKFFLPGETAMQLHPPEADHVNHYPYCLHLWRPADRVIPLPPKRFV